MCFQIQLVAVAIADMDIQLAESDFHVVLMAEGIDVAVQLVGGGQAVVDVIHVDAQFMVQGAGTKAHKQYDRFRVTQYAAVLFCGLKQNVAAFLQIGAVGKADFENDPGHGVGEGPVDQPFGDEHLVGDQDFLAVEINQGGGTDANAADGAIQVVDGNHVTDANRALEQQDDTGDKVGKDFLQAKTQPDAQCRHQPLHLVPAQAQRAKRQHDTAGDNHVGEQGGGGVAGALAQIHT